MKTKTESRIKCPDCKQLGGKHLIVCQMFKPQSQPLDKTDGHTLKSLSDADAKTPEDETDEEIAKNIVNNALKMAKSRKDKTSGDFCLSDIFEQKKFCVYCRASPEFCRCKNEIKYAVWKDVIEEDVKEFVRRLKEDTGCLPINSREKQIVELFKERIDALAGEKLI